MMQNCPDEGDWSNFAAGRVPLAKVERLAAHLDDCAVCQSTLRQLGRDSDTLLSRLQKRPAVGTYDDEPELRQALDRIQASFAPLRDDRPQHQAAAASRVETPFQTERFGAYEVLERLGSGGMGVVFNALQPHLNRMVALKILPEERLRDPGAVARFRREMKAVGKLDHPNIVRAYDAGEVAGKYFLAMELVDGVDLSRLAARLGSLPLADACELVRQAAAGLEHARSHGMVHRDVKPSNLMLSANGQVKILDLGLATLADGHASSDDLTAAEQLMGTLDYLAPEQAEDSRAVDIRADVYSLGCTLYRLLAGAAPFAGPKFNTPLKKVLAHARSQAEPIRRFCPEAPDALAAVLERMMAKSPEDRFATPAEVAQALAPFTAGSNLPTLLAYCRSIPAKPASGDAPTTTSAFRPSVSGGTQPDAVQLANSVADEQPLSPRSSKHRFFVAAAGAAALGVLCGVIVVIKDRYGNKIAEMEVPKAGSVIIKSNAEKPAASPHAAPQTAKVDVAAGSAKPDGKIERALAPQTDSLGPGGLASRPEPIAGLNGWNLVSREPLVPEADAAFHPTDPVLATAGPDGVIRIRDSATFEVKRAWPASSLWIEHLAWSPDGRRLAAIARSSQDVMVWDYSSAKIAYVLSGHHGDVNRVAFSPDGALAATVGADLDPSLRIWDANDGRLRHVIPLPAPSSTLAWSSDSKRIATFSQGEKSVRIWEAATGSPLKTVACEAAIKVGAWKPGGKSIAVYCDDHVIRLIDARDDTVERRLPVAGTEVLALEWSPDGQFIAAGEIRAAYDFPVRVWNATTWEVVREFKPGKLSNRLHWSSDSQMLSAGGFFNALRNVTVFHVSKDEPLWTTKAAYFLAAFSNLAWSPVHERQAACGADKFVRLCNLSPLRTVAEFGGLDAPPATIAWSPDGARIAAIASNGQLALWDVATRQLRDSVRLEPRESWPTWLLGWSADGRTLVSGTYGPGSVKMWDVSAGRMVVREIEGGLGRGPLAVSPSGGLFAYQQDDGNATVIWDFATGEVRRKFSVGGVRACSWSPEGQRLCIVAGFQVSVYDVQGKQQPRQLQAGGDWWRSIEWSRDGARIALGGEYCIATCDAASRNVERRFSTPAEERQQLSFSPHCDSWLASASPEGAVRFWNIQRSVPQGFLLRREEKLTAVGINGHVSGDENQFLYVALTDVGRESFNASEFTAKYGWKNDPGGVRLIDFDEPPNDPAESRTKSPANEPRLRD